MTTVGLLGEGVAMEAVRAALADTDAGAVAVDPAGVGGCDVAVAVGPSGGEDDGGGLLERTGAQARKTHFHLSVHPYINRQPEISSIITELLLIADINFLNRRRKKHHFSRF